MRGTVGTTVSVLDVGKRSALFAPSLRIARRAPGGAAGCHTADDDDRQPAETAACLDRSLLALVLMLVDIDRPSSFIAVITRLVAGVVSMIAGCITVIVQDPATMVMQDGAATVIV